jgi:glucose-6-phosphate dehydrogenase assembly protein OpcA
VSTSPDPAAPPVLETSASAAVPLTAVEKELGRRVQALQSAGTGPVVRACMSNLVVYCDRRQLADVTAAVPAVVALHPARVLLLCAEPEGAGHTLTAGVEVCALPAGHGNRIFAEQVTLRATGRAVERLPFAVRSLLIGDLPTNLWWAVPQPPPQAGVLLYDLVERVEQVIYDSVGWTEPARGVVATANWLAQTERTAPGAWRVASDLNWRRLKYWRRLLGQALDPATAPGALESVSEVLLEHGPHAVVQAWELVSWLASLLDWKVEAGRLQPGVEIAWQFQAPHGTVRVRLHRLEEGPPTIRRLGLACQRPGQPPALYLFAEGDRRLSVYLEGTGAAPRTVTVPPQPLAELVGRQLSDRERDPVFNASMAVARVLAQSVLDRQRQ